MLKSSMLQRALKFGAQEIASLHSDVEYAKIALRQWSEDKIYFAAYIEQDSKYIKNARKRIKQFAELQVFLKRELQQAYIEEARIAWRERVNEMRIRTQGLFRHAPIFMAEAPPAEIGSFVEDEQ